MSPEDTPVSCLWHVPTLQGCIDPQRVTVYADLVTSSISQLFTLYVRTLTGKTHVIETHKYETIDVCECTGSPTRLCRKSAC